MNLQEFIRIYLSRLDKLEGFANGIEDADASDWLLSQVYDARRNINELVETLKKEGKL